MKKVIILLETYLLPIANKIGKNRYLNVLRDSFMLSFPLTIFGSLFIVLTNLPFLNILMSENRIQKFKDYLTPSIQASFMLMTIFIVIGIGYYLLTYYDGDGIFGSAISLTSFFILTPFENNSIPIDRLGAKGIFVGIITSIIAVEIYKKTVEKGWTIKLPDSVPPAVSKAFSAVIPGTITLIFFLLLKIIFSFTPYGNIHDFIYKVIQTPLIALGRGLPATIIAIFLIQILWFFGLHGQIIVNSILDPIWNTLSLQNLEAYHAGIKLPNIITKQFIEIYTVGLGGTGMTLAVVVAMLFVMKSKQLKQTGKLAAPAAIFNVNEPVIFGLPIVMNPLIFIPWVVSPILVVIITYFSMYIGIVPLTTGVAVPWTLPLFFSGVLATNSLMGGILQIINFFIVFIIWFPFLKAIDNSYIKEECKDESEYS